MSVRPFVRPSLPSAYTAWFHQGSMRRGQRTFRPEDDRDTCWFVAPSVGAYKSCTRGCVAEEPRDALSVRIISIRWDPMSLRLLDYLIRFQRYYHLFLNFWRWKKGHITLNTPPLEVICHVHAITLQHKQEHESRPTCILHFLKIKKSRI